MRYVALLRGINIGPHKKVAMPAFREMLAGMGYGEVATYIQSGNALFTAPEADAATYAAEIEKAIAEHFRLDVPTVVLPGALLPQIVAENPFPDGPTMPKIFHVGFTSSPPDPARLAGLDHAKYLPDRVAAGSHALYLNYAAGVHVSKLTTPVLERQLGITVTARNWNTVLKLLEMAEAG